MTNLKTRATLRWKKKNPVQRLLQSDRNQNTCEELQHRTESQTVNRQSHFKPDSKFSENLKEKNPFGLQSLN